MKVVITDVEGNEGRIYLSAPLPPSYHDHYEGWLEISDGRRISPDQRKLVYALFRDISEHTGHTPNELKDLLKCDYIATTGAEWFSLSNVDMTTARYFIEFILEFCFRIDVPLSADVSTMAKEVQNYLFICIKYRRCVCCGGHADIHHVDKVGMGRDRTTVDHTKHRLMALCRGHHSECHTVGQETFNRKYIVEGIEINEKTARELGL